MLLIPPRRMSLEQAIAYIEDDELVEVTPRCDAPAQALPRSRMSASAPRNRPLRRPRNRNDPLKSRDATFTDRLETAAKAKQAQLARARAEGPHQGSPNSPPARKPAPPPPMRARSASPTAQIAKLAEREKESGRTRCQGGRAGRPRSRRRAGRVTRQQTARAPPRQKAARDARYAARKARKK